MQPNDLIFADDNAPVVPPQSVEKPVHTVLVIEAGIVVNRILAPVGESSPDPSQLWIDDVPGVAIGSAITNEGFQPPAPAPPHREAIQSECSRRIYAVASDNAQKNMLASIAAGLMSDADKALFDAGVLWIAQMQETCRALVATQDASYAADDRWPSVPAGVADLAARF